MRFRIALGILSAAAALAGPAAAAPAPHLRAQTLSDLGPDLPYPFDSDANADQAVAKATAEAASSGKLLLIDLGGNWCAGCRVLAAVMALPEMKPFVEAHYVVVSVDVGMLDKNLQIPARYGITGRLSAVPAVLIIDPVTGTLVNKGDIEALATPHPLAPQALADWLAKWAR
jgi:thiol-disulfide isomerase/thioredoxin